MKDKKKIHKLINKIVYSIIEIIKIRILIEITIKWIKCGKYNSCVLISEFRKVTHKK